MTQLTVLVAGLLFLVESQASNVADRSTLQGFLSKYDAPRSSMSHIDKFITPNLNLFKHGNGAVAVSSQNNPAELGPSMGGSPFMIVDDKPVLHPTTEVQDSMAFAAAKGEPSISTKDLNPPTIADREEKQAAQKLVADVSSNPMTLSAIGIGLLSLATMLGVWLQRRLQPATVLASSGGLGPLMPIDTTSALGDNVMEMKSQDPHMVNSSRVGWEQLSSQHSRPLTFCYACKQTGSLSMATDMTEGISDPVGFFDPAGIRDDLAETSVLLRQPTDVGAFLELSNELARFNASPMAIAELTEAIDFPIPHEEDNTMLVLANIAKTMKRWRRSQLLTALLRKNRSEYVATVSFLNIPRAELPNVEGMPLREYDPNPRRPEAVLDASDTGGLTPDSKLLPMPFQQNLLERFLLSEFRDIFVAEAGIQRGPDKDIIGLLKDGQTYMLTGATPEDMQQMTVRGLRAIMLKWTPFLLPFLRIFMGGIVPSYDPNDKRAGADPEWLADGVQWMRSKLPFGKDFLEPGKQLGPLFYAPFLTALVAQYAIRPLAGPFRLSLRSNGELGAMVGERCIFLQESNCKGMCLHYCKVPAQELFEELGVPLYVQPNFETQECSWSFGDKAPPPEEDPAWPAGCVVSCSSRKAVAELGKVCE
jgi:hypothetical protein